MTKGSGDARMQPLYFLITTAGTDTKSICYETHQKAKDILEERKVDSTFYPVIFMVLMKMMTGQILRYGRKQILVLGLLLELIRSKLLVNQRNRILLKRTHSDS